MVDVDTLVIGAGIVGLACAAELARRGDAVLVIERHGGFARETSSRNSGVVHAGLYYPAGSLKALTCVEGRELLYARCARDGVAHRVVGKLIVATTDDEVPTLERLHALGRDNGAGDLALIDGAEVVLVASKGGHSDHPDWYKNLSADPHVEITRDSVTVPMLARTATGDERAELWPRIVASYKGYEGYQRNTDREIPVVICEPAT